MSSIDDVELLGALINRGKGAGTPSFGLEPFPGVGKGFVATPVRNEKERLRELHWAKLSGMEQSGNSWEDMNPSARRIV